jgi:hypothetical protein
VRTNEPLAKKIGFLILLILAVVLVFRIPLLSEEEEHGEAHEHHFHDHHLGLTLAATTHLEEGGGTHFTLGAEYEYRLSQLIGIGLIGELIFAEHTEYLFVLPLYVHATESLWFRAGPGFEVTRHSEEKPHCSCKEDQDPEHYTSNKAKFLMRIGVGYNIDVGGFIITPTVDIDFLRTQTSLVWGIVIGRGF